MCCKIQIVLGVLIFLRVYSFGSNILLSYLTVENNSNSFVTYHVCQWHLGGTYEEPHSVEIVVVIVRSACFVLKTLNYFTLFI